MLRYCKHRDILIETSVYRQCAKCVGGCETVSIVDHSLNSDEILIFHQKLVKNKLREIKLERILK